MINNDFHSLECHLLRWNVYNGCSEVHFSVVLYARQNKKYPWNKSIYTFHVRFFLIRENSYNRFGNIKSSNKKLTERKKLKQVIYCNDYFHNGNRCNKFDPNH